VFLNFQNIGIKSISPSRNTQLGKGSSLLIGGDVQLYHNGSFKRTSIGGGVDYYTGDGDIWIIFRNLKARSRYNFKTSNGKVQICDGY